MDSTKKFKLVLLLGQSNAQGQSTVRSNLSGDYANYGDPLPGVRIAQQLVCNSDSGAAACAYEWPLMEMKARANSVGEFGPEIGIARSIPNIESHAADKHTVIVKCASGATDLANDWAEDAVSGYILYSRMKDFVEHTAQAWASSYEVVGCIWVQGEADAAIEAEANAYEANLNSFIAQLRTDFSNATMPFIISRLHASNVATYAATVRAAQDAVAAADSNVTVVTPTPSLSGDNVHYDENGYAELGETDLGPALDAKFSLCGG